MQLGALRQICEMLHVYTMLHLPCLRFAAVENSHWASWAKPSISVRCADTRWNTPRTNFPEQTHKQCMQLFCQPSCWTPYVLPMSLLIISSASWSFIMPSQLKRQLQLARQTVSAENKFLSLISCRLSLAQSPTQSQVSFDVIQRHMMHHFVHRSCALENPQAVPLCFTLLAIQNTRGANKDLLERPAKALFCHISPLVSKSLCSSAAYHTATVVVLKCATLWACHNMEAQRQTAWYSWGCQNFIKQWQCDRQPSTRAKPWCGMHCTCLFSLCPVQSKSEDLCLATNPIRPQCKCTVPSAQVCRVILPQQCKKEIQHAQHGISPLPEEDWVIWLDCWQFCELLHQVHAFHHTAYHQIGGIQIWGWLSGYDKPTAVWWLTGCWLLHSNELAIVGNKLSLTHPIRSLKCCCGDNSAVCNCTYSRQRNLVAPSEEHMTSQFNTTHKTHMLNHVGDAAAADYCCKLVSPVIDNLVITLYGIVPRRTFYTPYAHCDLWAWELNCGRHVHLCRTVHMLMIVQTAAELQNMWFQKLTWCECPSQWGKRLRLSHGYDCSQPSLPTYSRQTLIYHIVHIDSYIN